MIRFAIWAAVSTAPQATTDKVSLQAQEDACRAAGQAEGWTETAVYRVPGASRSFYVNLADAERDIPALRKLLDDARAGAFDVLAIYTYDRLGDLADMVAQSLRWYGVQIYSVTQPVLPQPPDEFDPLSEGEAIMRDVHRITQRFRINDLRRKRRAAMPKRILEKGLPPTRIPFGYRKPKDQLFNPDAIPEQDPIRAAAVIRIKDLFLGGFSLNQIADALNELHVPVPRSKKGRWTNTMVHHILSNPFYGGTVFFGYERRVFDPRTRKVAYEKNPPSRVIKGHGAHEPLWDEATQRRIDGEFERRRINYTGVRTNRLSNLLYCGICGERVYVGYGGHYTGHGVYRFWRCRADRAHVLRRDDELLQCVANEAAATFRNTENIQLPEPEEHRPDLSRSLADLQAQQDRLDEAYKVGAMALPKYSQLSAELEIQISAVEQQLDREECAGAELQEQLAAMRALGRLLSEVPDYILEAPPQLVNAFLRKVLERIVITPTSIEFKIRTRR